MLQKALGCLFVFGIAPVGIGGLWTKGIGQKREKILNLYLAGFLSELAVFQLIAVPVMVKEGLWDEPAGISDNCGFCSVGCDGIYLDASAGTRLAEADWAE